MANQKNPPSPIAIIGFGIALLVLFWLVLSSYGLFNNFLSWDAQQAGIGWKIVGTIFLIIAGVLFYNLATGRVQSSVGMGVAVMVCLALSISANVGFKFTGGDIKQRITFINLDGKITDIEGFTKYYGDFYHLDTDTALVNYINTYDELPGVNNWAFNICCAIPASTRHPKSTAPRANETPDQFPWHTGSYEMDPNQ